MSADVSSRAVAFAEEAVKIATESGDPAIIEAAALIVEAASRVLESVKAGRLAATRSLDAEARDRAPRNGSREWVIVTSPPFDRIEFVNRAANPGGYVWGDLSIATRLFSLTEAMAWFGEEFGKPFCVSHRIVRLADAWEERRVLLQAVAS